MVCRVCCQCHSETDWCGLYAIDVASAPGASDGMWVYVPSGGSGAVTFPASICPKREGVYEIRYHLDNRYQVVAAAPILLT